mgnify:CR=1 FL=1
MMATKIAAFTTDTVDVVWAHLHTPDTKFGDDSANHSVTVLVDSNLQETLDSLTKETSASKINGMRTDDEGRVLLKAKSKIFVKDDIKAFPCLDAGANKTEAVAFGGDKVRLRLAPAILSRDGSMSLYLNGCQIIEKVANNYSGGFTPTDGFDGASYVAPTTPPSDDDIPF